MGGCISQTGHRGLVKSQASSPLNGTGVSPKLAGTFQGPQPPGRRESPAYPSGRDKACWPSDQMLSILREHALSAGDPGRPASSHSTRGAAGDRLGKCLPLQVAASILPGLHFPALLTPDPSQPIHRARHGREKKDDSNESWILLISSEKVRRFLPGPSQPVLRAARMVV